MPEVKDPTLGGSMLADHVTRVLPVLCGFIGAAGAGVLVPAIIYSMPAYLALGAALIVLCLVASLGAYRLRQRHEAIVKDEAAKRAARKAAKKAKG